MTNNKGPQVRLAWAYRAVLRDREDLGQAKGAVNETVLCDREVLAQ
jgi:hypothetical protein